jgi:hypothetical protein
MLKKSLIAGVAALLVGISATSSAYATGWWVGVTQFGSVCRNGVYFWDYGYPNGGIVNYSCTMPNGMLGWWSPN